MKRKLLFFLLSILILLPLISVNSRTAEAALTARCSLERERVVDDSGGWSPASNKSTQINFPLSYSNETESMPNEVEAFIAYKNNKPVRILESSQGNGAGLTVNKDQNKININNIKTRGNGAGSYFHAGVSVTADKWRTGDYSLIIVPKNKSVDEQICRVSFEIKPYCVIELNGSAGDYKPGWIPSFKVTNFHPYGAGGVAPETQHLIQLFKGEQEVDATSNIASYIKDPGISFPNAIPIGGSGSYQIRVSNVDDTYAECKSNEFIVSQAGGHECVPSNMEGCKEIEGTTTNASLAQPCNESDLAANGDGCKRIDTALGYVSTDASNFTRWVLGFILSISGGIVILIIIITGYKLMTSQGDPEKVKGAKDQLTAAIIGLLFIIFSLAILELITRDILGLPGFGS